MELFNWLSKLKNVVLSNGFKNMRNVIQMALILKQPFSKALQKIAKRLETLPPNHRLRHVLVTVDSSTRIPVSTFRKTS